jgi:hypothetical protein
VHLFDIADINIYFSSKLKKFDLLQFRTEEIEFYILLGWGGSKGVRSRTFNA